MRACVAGMAFSEVAVGSFFSVIDADADGEISRAELRDSLARIAALRPALGVSTGILPESPRATAWVCTKEQRERRLLLEVQRHRLDHVRRREACRATLEGIVVGVERISAEEAADVAAV